MESRINFLAILLAGFTAIEAALLCFAISVSEY